MCIKRDFTINKKRWNRTYCFIVVVLKNKDSYFVAKSASSRWWTENCWSRIVVNPIDRRVENHCSFSVTVVKSVSLSVMRTPRIEPWDMAWNRSSSLSTVSGDWFMSDINQVTPRPRSFFPVRAAGFLQWKNAGELQSICSRVSTVNGSKIEDIFAGSTPITETLRFRSARTTPPGAHPNSTTMSFLSNWIPQKFQRLQRFDQKLMRKEMIAKWLEVVSLKQ